MSTENCETRQCEEHPNEIKHETEMKRNVFWKHIILNFSMNGKLEMENNETNQYV